MNVAYDRALAPAKYEMCKANSGTLHFKVRFPLGSGVAKIAFTTKDDPSGKLYEISLYPIWGEFIDAFKQNIGEHKVRFNILQPITSDYKPFWVTWYNGEFNLYCSGTRQRLFKYKDFTKKGNIGYVKFYTMGSHGPAQWEYEDSPVLFREIKPCIFDGGKLTWKEMIGEQLPQDALIGGFEKETIYVARAKHMGSVCPGKYVPSQRKAFVPWGGRAHAKDQFEILCGYDAIWVKTRGSKIPRNAFIGGTSEVRGEPLYVARTLIDFNLVCGKVHAIYSTAFLPYENKEVERQYYEILVLPNSTSQDVEIP